MPAITATIVEQPPPVPMRILRNAPLFAQVCEFNLLLARQVQPEHVQDWIHPGLFERLAECPRGAQRLTEILLGRNIATRETWFDFEDPRRRLALLPGYQLLSIRDHVAAALSADDLRKVVDRPTRTRLLARLGKPLFEFAEKRAPFLIGTIGPLPAGPDPDVRDPLGRFESRARLCMTAWFGDQPPAILGRLRLKLPPGELPDSLTSPDSSSSSTIWNVTQRILHSQFPEARDLLKA